MGRSGREAAGMRSDLVIIVIMCTLAATPVEAGGGYVAPRTPFGDPDLQGIWTNASLTTLERPAGVKELVLTAEQAARMVAAASRRPVRRETRGGLMSPQRPDKSALTSSRATA